MGAIDETKEAELVNRLCQHAGIPAGEEVPTDTLAEFAFRPTDRVDLIDITEDIIGCFDILNQHINKASAPNDIRQNVSRRLAYAASSIMRICLNTIVEQHCDSVPKTARGLLRAAWRIQLAWDALLAGDVPDLRKHIREEANVRGMSE